MNQQPITPQDLTQKKLRVNEIFNSIQGEGPWSGHSVVFLRLSGCNLCCTWCDTEYTTSIIMTLPRILRRIDSVCEMDMATRVVITGGEPFTQNLVPLINALYDRGTAIQIETNGTLSNPGFPFEKVTLVCSPKAGRIHPDIVEHCYAFKYVVAAGEINHLTGLPSTSTQENGSRPPPVPPEILRAAIWLMPRDGWNDSEQHRNEKVAIEMCHLFGYRLSMRLHKILGLR